MSAASPARKLGRLRELRDEERAMLIKMIAGTPFEESIAALLSEMRVQDMPDGGMGSIKFYNSKPRSELEYGKQIAEASFQDADGVPVSATLSVDKDGNLFELDLFKADGSPLVRYPDLDDLQIIERHGQLGFPPQAS
jgi:hypothetical protein